MENVRVKALKYRQKEENLPPSGRRKNPRQCGPEKKGPALGRENCVLVIGNRSNYWTTAKQARYKLRKRLAVILSSKPFIIQEKHPSRPVKDDLIIEKVFSSLACRSLRVHREELHYLILKAKTGKPRKAYIDQPADPLPYVPLPCGFNLDNRE